MGWRRYIAGSCIMHLPQHVAWYLICFAIGSVAGLVPVWIIEVLENTDDGLADTIVAIGREMDWIALVSGAYSFAGVEGFTMLAEVFLRRREAKGRAEGRVEERQQIASRFEDMTPEERLAEIERLIEEARRDSRNTAE